MRKLALILITLFLLAVPALAQDSFPYVRQGTTLPLSCSNRRVIFHLTATDGLNSAGLYRCNGSIYVAVGSGSGDVSGPASSTDNAVVRFDSTSGKIIQNSAVTIADSGNMAGVGTLNTHTIPGGTDTFAMLAATQVLTNKTLTAPVINSPTGIVKGDVGLGNVDNTSDANKPVSTAQQTALDLKQNLLTNSAGLRTALSDESGTGAALFSGGNIGAATATSINNVAITAPASSATLTIANGKTLTVSNSVAVTGTDGSSLNIGTGGSIGGFAGWTDGVSRTINAATTNYNYLVRATTTTTFNGTESNRQNVMPDSGTLSRLYLRTSTTQPSDGSMVCTVRVAGADTSITVTVAANTAAGTFSDTTHTATFAAGDLLSLKCVNNSPTTTSAGVIDVALVVVKN